MYWYWFIFNCSYGTLNYSSIHVVSQEMHPSFNLTFTSVMMSKLCVYSCSDTRVVQESCQCCVPVMRMDAAHAALYSYMCSRQPPKTHFGSYLNTVCRFSHLHESVCAWYPWSSPACFPLAPSLSGLGVGRAQYMYGTWDDITPPYLRAALFLKLKRAILSSLSHAYIFLAYSRR